MSFIRLSPKIAAIIRGTVDLYLELNHAAHIQVLSITHPSASHHSPQGSDAQVVIV